MLLAEINGKRSLAISGNEDYLTSCVFGHLRHVRDGRFWRAFASCARTIDGSDTSLLAELSKAGAHIAEETAVRVVFWPYHPKYGEPDLLLSFVSASGKPVVVLVEVKLYSNKSSTGEDDQLRKYFRFLHDRSILQTVLKTDLADVELALVYLTERYAAADLIESVELTRPEFCNAGQRMLLLQWQDLTELLIAQQPKPESLLGEVLAFLLRREYRHFRNFTENSPPPDLAVDGSFYEGMYFNDTPDSLSALMATECFYGG